MYTTGSSASVGDTTAFASDTDPDEGYRPPPRPPSLRSHGTCESDIGALCLHDGRYRVEVDWTDFAGTTGRGRVVPTTDDTGAFWFFGPANVELLVKVLDGRSLNGKGWVFFGSTSNVGFTITVTDTSSGEQRRYQNPAGTFASRGDTEAFDGDG